MGVSVIMETPQQKLVDIHNIYGQESERVISFYGGLVPASSFLKNLVRSGELTFPYRSLFGPKADVLWETLQTSSATYSTQDYEMLSYYPKYGSYLPPRFITNESSIPVSISDIPSQVSYLTDYYQEHVRLKARRYDQNLSVSEIWSPSNEQGSLSQPLKDEADRLLETIWMRALQSNFLTLDVVREASESVVAETKTFSLMWIKGLIELLMPDYRGKKYIDISAGWGDRLEVAMSLGMQYRGYDPNLELKEGHDRMIADHGDRRIHQVVYSGFEEAELEDDSYDFAACSPPFFNLEVYSEDKGQSVVKAEQHASLQGKSQEDIWMVHFLFKSISIIWRSLKVGGIFALHLGDAPTIRSAEPANFYIETLPGAHWLGAIGVYSRSGRRPVWCWKKGDPSLPPSLWKPEIPNARPQNHKLGYTYPSYAAELINSRLSSPEVRLCLDRVGTIVKSDLPSVDPLLVYSITKDKWNLWSTILKRALLRKSKEEGTENSKGKEVASKIKIDGSVDWWSPLVWYQLLLELGSIESVQLFADVTNKYSPGYQSRVNNFRLFKSRYPGADFNPVVIIVSAETAGWHSVIDNLSDLY
jgi:hypothetical protein